MKLFLPLTVALLGLSSISQASENWEITGFEMPESALYDSAHNRLIVSNIKGHPAKPDGDGYLSLVSPDGKIIDAKWATGLDAPKGMALVGDELLVTDLNKLRIVDNKTGKLIKTLEADGAKFLNDITSDGKTAWISDFFTHTIWQYKDGEMSVWMHDPALNHPNGLLIEKGRLVVGSWGPGMKDDFSTDGPGDLMSVDLKTKKITIITHALGNLDGVVAWKGGYMVSNWISGELYELDSSGKLMNTRLFKSGLADIGTTGKAIIAPLMMDGKLLSLSE